MLLDNMPPIGAIVIGRDLGPRLLPSIRSVQAAGRPVVYVDSDSRDASAQVARDAGVAVVVLPGSAPLSASMGRNAGINLLRRTHPTLELIQFVDGDCEIDAGWIDAAAARMREDPTLGLVCGHVREKHRAQSLAATLLDIDWGGPIGEIKACGGIFLARAAAVHQVTGFSTELPAGEEAEFCARIRAAGWRVERIDRPMCSHDAGIHSLGEWWRRAVRVGRAYAMSARLTGVSADPAHKRRVWRVLTWTVALPGLAIAGLALAWWTPVALVVPALFVGLCLVQMTRVAARQVRAGRSPRVAAKYALFNLLAKWAHLRGCVQVWTKR